MIAKVKRHFIGVCNILKESDCIFTYLKGKRIYLPTLNTKKVDGGETENAQ